jgi:hypothetical protein
LVDPESHCGPAAVRLRPYRSGTNSAPAILPRGVFMPQIEIDMDKVTPQGFPYTGGFVEEIRLSANSKVWVRVCTATRFQFDHDRFPTDEEHRALMEEWLYVDKQQTEDGKTKFDYYAAKPVISFLPSDVRPCPVHSSYKKQDGHTVSAWLNYSLFGGYACAIKVEGQFELVTARPVPSER